MKSPRVILAPKLNPSHALSAISIGPCFAMTSQVETVVLFFLHMQGALAAKLLQARMGAAGHGLVEGVKALSSPPSSPADTYQVYREIGKQIVHLIRFLRLNGESLSSYAPCGCDSMSLRGRRRG